MRFKERFTERIDRIKITDTSQIFIYFTLEITPEYV